MKILQINSVCGVGSTGRIAVDIAKTAQEQGNDALIAYGRSYKETPGIKAIRIGSDYEVYLHGLYTRLTDKTGFASTMATVKFIEEVRRYKPDIIHLHNIHGYYVNIELLFNFLRKANIPVVWTLHDCWAFTGHCTHFDYVGCNQWKTGCNNNCPQKQSYPASLFLSNAASNYRKKRDLFTSVNNMTIVTPSQWLAGLVKESFLQKYPVKVIHNGIDTEIFKPTPSDFRQKYGLEDKFIVLGVANVLDKRKGLEDFIKLSDMLDDSYRIVLVGLSEKQIKNLPDKKIIGITRTSNATELAGIYSTADIFVNASVEETFGLTNVEALACRTPVIAYDCGPTNEIVDGDCSKLVPNGDVYALKTDVGKTLQKDDVHHARNVEYTKKFDKREKFIEYVRLYSKILIIILVLLYNNCNLFDNIKGFAFLFKEYVCLKVRPL